MTGVVTVFADVGQIAHEEGQLPDALLELAVRLDIKGAGDLLDVLMRTCFTPHDHDGRCPACGTPQGETT